MLQSRLTDEEKTSLTPSDDMTDQMVVNGKFPELVRHCSCLLTCYSRDLREGHHCGTGSIHIENDGMAMEINPGVG